MTNLLSVRWPRRPVTAFLFLTSEAFYSMTSYPIVLAIIRIDDVLPIPGGPDTRHALAFTLLVYQLSIGKIGGVY